MTEQTETTTLRVPIKVRDEVNDLMTAMKRETGRSTTHGELVGALAHGVPPWQADLMVRAYALHTDDIQKAATGEIDEFTTPG